jgi:hypothetical protein
MGSPVQSGISQVWPQSEQTQTTMVLLLTVLQSVHSVFLDLHCGQFDMALVRYDV